MSGLACLVCGITTTHQTHLRACSETCADEWRTAIRQKETRKRNERRKRRCQTDPDYRQRLAEKKRLQARRRNDAKRDPLKPKRRYIRNPTTEQIKDRDRGYYESAKRRRMESDPAYKARVEQRAWCLAHPEEAKARRMEADRLADRLRRSRDDEHRERENASARASYYRRRTERNLRREKRRLADAAIMAMMTAGSVACRMLPIIQFVPRLGLIHASWDFRIAGGQRPLTQIFPAWTAKIVVVDDLVQRQPVAIYIHQTIISFPDIIPEKGSRGRRLSIIKDGWTHRQYSRLWNLEHAAQVKDANKQRYSTTKSDDPEKYQATLARSRDWWKRATQEQKDARAARRRHKMEDPDFRNRRLEQDRRNRLNNRDEKLERRRDRERSKSATRAAFRELELIGD
jgi:hypothetical protein